MTGHLLGAAGGVEAIASVLSIRDSFIPPTINTENIDEVISVNVVYGKMQEAKVSYALSNSLGFGGHNASILFKEWEGK
jgi:3-oxoacyl-[acyl-carrier-protein] synthase II